MKTRDDLVPVNNIKGGPYPSIEVDVDAVHAFDKEWTEIVHRYTRDWCRKNKFAGPATVWDWATESLNFHNESRPVVFLVPQGFPESFVNGLGDALVSEAPNAIRAASDYCTPKRSQGWAPTVHCQDGKAWFKVDEITWREI